MFETILENTSNEPIIYLKDIKHQEMESILQFMYLGKASFYQERMKEFLDVAKNLEVKELSKGVEVDEENKFTDQTTSEDDELQEKTFDSHSSNSANQGIEQDRPSSEVDPASRQCPDCGKEFSYNSDLLKHHRAEHQGIRYPCSQCDYIAKFQRNLKRHIESEHQGIRFPCSQCDHRAKFQSDLRRHIENEHQGVRYPCNYCNYQSKQKHHLISHIKRKHA